MTPNASGQWDKFGSASSASDDAQVEGSAIVGPHEVNQRADAELNESVFAKALRAAQASLAGPDCVDKVKIEDPDVFMPTAESSSDDDDTADSVARLSAHRVTTGSRAKLASLEEHRQARTSSKALEHHRKKRAQQIHQEKERKPAHRKKGREAKSAKSTRPPATAQAGSSKALVAPLTVRVDGEYHDSLDEAEQPPLKRRCITSPVTGQHPSHDVNQNSPPPAQVDQSAQYSTLSFFSKLHTFYLCEGLQRKEVEFQILVSGSVFRHTEVDR